jgi:hypothetical protein
LSPHTVIARRDFEVTLAHSRMPSATCWPTNPDKSASAELKQDLTLGCITREGLFVQTLGRFGSRAPLTP